MNLTTFLAKPTAARSRIFDLTPELADSRPHSVRELAGRVISPLRVLRCQERNELFIVCDFTDEVR